MRKRSFFGGSMLALCAWLCAAPALAQSGTRCIEGEDGCHAEEREACRRSVWCRERGLCGPSAGGCAATTDEDCARAVICIERGRCLARGGICVADERSMPPPPLLHPHCIEACRDDGRCLLRGSECLVGRDADCRQSRLCAERGRCAAVEGRCLAVSAVDCRASRQCRDAGACFVDVDDGECDDGADRFSEPTMITGGVIAGVGLLGGLVGLWHFLLVESGEVGRAHLAVWAGSASVLLTGLTMVAVGGHRVTREQQSGALPTITLGPAGASLHWAF